MPSTPLALSVLSFLDRIKRNPALASDPAFLQELQTDATEDMQDAYVSLATPKANDTWETSVDFITTDTESPVSSIAFPEPVRIIAMLPVIVPAVPFTSFGPPAVRAVNVASLDDVRISVTVDKKVAYTSQEDTSTTTTTAGPNAFVTASALSILLPRLWDIMIESTNPKIEFVWQWKQGPNIFRDSICSIACMFQWKNPRTGRWGNSTTRSNGSIR
jgi:hypothetical protein